MSWEEIPEINLYSDGGAEPNPGKGGFGVVMSYKGKKKEFSQGYKLTTNNRMELMGVIYGLERLKTKSIVHIYTDSRYVVDGITNGWALKWKSKNWYKSKGVKALNPDLWDRLLTLISEQQKVIFHWIKGHNGHPENERCDELASLALNGHNLLEDRVYMSLKYDNDLDENKREISKTENSLF
ncbi:MAG: RNase [Bacteroidetes bacterium]|nr:RNase [Bacteroidota bacterium]